MAQKGFLEEYRANIKSYKSRVASIYATNRSSIPDMICIIRQSTDVQTATKHELDAAGKTCGVCCAERIPFEQRGGTGQCQKYGHDQSECVICKRICCELCSRHDEMTTESSTKRICHSKACSLTHQYQQGLMSAEEFNTTTDRVSRELICQWIVFQSKMEKCLGYRRALLLYDAERVVKMTS
jgi:hypothetical protein